MISFLVADPLFDHFISSTSSEAELTSSCAARLGISGIRSVSKSWTAGSDDDAFTPELAGMMAAHHALNDSAFGTDELESLETWHEFLSTQRDAVRRIGAVAEVPAEARAECQAAAAPPSERVDVDAIMTGRRYKGVELPVCSALYVLAVVDDGKAPAIACASIVAEVYPSRNVAMVSYAVTAPAFRGQGLARKLARYVAWHMDALCRFFTGGTPLQALLVDVEEVAPLRRALHAAREKEAKQQAMEKNGGGDDDDDDDQIEDLEAQIRTATERQVIWSRIGFSPIESARYVLRYPSYLSSHTYCVGVWRETAAEMCGGSSTERQQQLTLPSRLLQHFVEVMSVSVFFDERSELERLIAQKEELQERSTKTGALNKDLLDPEKFERIVTSFVIALRAQFAALPPQLLVGDAFWN